MDLFQKLDHPIPEVRQRALRDLQFKLRSGIVTTDALCYEKEGLAKLLNCLDPQDYASESLHNYLYILKELIHNDKGREELGNLGVRHVLLDWQKAIPLTDSSSSIVTDLLQRVIHVPSYTVDPKRPVRDISSNAGLRTSPALTALASVPTEHPHSRKHGSEPSTRDTSPTRLSPSRKPITSPLRRLPTAAPFTSLAYLPYAFKSYNTQYLTDADHHIINEFYKILKAEERTSNREHWEQDRVAFRHLLDNFGGQIFLQCPHLFQKMLRNATNNASSPSFMYLEEVVLSWSSSFRQAMNLTHVRHSTDEDHLFAPNLRTSTRSRKSDWDRPGPGINQNPISIPYACHEIFVNLAPLLRNLEWLPEVMRLLYSVLPFVKLHIEIAAQHMPGQDVSNLPIAYAHMLAEAAGYHSIALERDEGDLMGDLTLARERVVLMAVDMLCALEDSRMSDHTWDLKGIGMFFDFNVRIGFADSLASFIMDRPDNGVARDMLAWCLQYPSQRALKSVLQTVGQYWIQKNGLLHVFTQDQSILETVLNSVYAFSDKELQDIGYRLVEPAISAYDDAFRSKSLLPHLQLTYPTDNGKFLYAALAAAEDALTDDARISFWARALMHKNRGLREDAAFHLSALLPQPGFEKVVDDPADALYFHSTMLAIIQETRAEDSYLDKIDQIHDLRVKLDESTELREDDIATSLRDLTDSALSKQTTQEAAKAQIHLKLIELVADPPSWLLHSPCLTRIFSLLRGLIEQDAAMRADVRGAEVCVGAISQYIFQKEVQIRYDVARIFSAVLFPFDESSLSPEPSVLANYTLYGPASLKASQKPIDLHMDLIDEFLRPFWQGYRNYTRLPIVDSVMLHADNPYRYQLEQAFQRLQRARTHQDFALGLRAFRGACTCEKDAEYIIQYDLSSVYEKILLAVPSTPDDALLLIQVLHILRDWMIYPTTRAFFRDLLLRCAKELLVPALYRYIENQKNLPDEVDSTPGPTESAAPDQNPLFISELMRFLTVICEIVDDQDMSVLTATTNLPSLLCQLGDLQAKDGQFSETELLYTHRMLSRCVSAPNILAVVDTQCAKSTIKFLVSEIGTHQKASHESYTGSAPSRYKWKVYQLAVLSLRTLSRTAVVDVAGRLSCLWGDFWLFEESIEWLVALLDEPDEVCQQAGLGILANIALSDEGRQTVHSAMPKYQDVACASLASVVMPEYVRTEAALLLNNVLIATTTTSPPHSEESSNSESRIPPSFLELLQHHRTLAHLHEILDCASDHIAFRRALSELLLSLFILDTNRMQDALQTTQSWPLLLSYLDDFTVDDIQEEYDVIKRFKYHQMQMTCCESINSTKCNVLSMVWLDVHASPAVQLLFVQDTFVFRQLLNLLTQQFGRGVDSPPPTEGTSAARLLELALRVFAELLAEMASSRMKELNELLLGKSQSAASLCHLFISLINPADSSIPFPLLRVACQALARLLSLTCKENTRLDLSAVLSQPVDPLDTTGPCLAVLMSRRLQKVLLGMFEQTDQVLTESVYTALGCLLGYHDRVKIDCVENGFMATLVERGLTTLEECSVQDRMDGQQEEGLLIITFLIRQLLADSTIAKDEAILLKLPKFLHQLLSRRATSPPSLTLSTLQCLRNLIIDSRAGRTSVLKIQKNGTSLLTLLISTVINRGKVNRSDIFEESIECLKLLGLHTETRAALWKSNLLMDLGPILAYLVKSRDTTKIEPLLQFLLFAGYTLDGQVQMMRTPGLFELVFDVAVTSSLLTLKRTAVLVLRNFAISTENKTHFLLCPALIPNLNKLLSLSALDVLSATTSLIRTLLYKSEKAKLALKKGGMKGTLEDLQRRLQQGYGWFLDQSESTNTGSKNGAGKDLSEYDAGHLYQTTNHLRALLKLLSAA
ncbi:hypothetical protein DFS34DRAFT_636303 [Phlyctochytrium arcticum]|nr:hypothetical protein DFS34DRAFT_636303 [Phlyctochytrium arcticum]